MADELTYLESAYRQLSLWVKKVIHRAGFFDGIHKGCRFIALNPGAPQYFESKFLLAASLRLSTGFVKVRKPLSGLRVGSYRLYLGTNRPY